MLKETMTPRERWLAVLTRQKPDRVPMDYWATPEFTAQLLRHLGYRGVGEAADQSPDTRQHWYSTDLEREALRRLHVDFVVTVSPRYIGPPLPKNTDVFGCRFQDIHYGSGVYSECIYHPLAQYRSVEEIECHYTWPNPDWWDYGDLPQQVKGWEMYPVRGGGSEPFLIYKNLRGQEQALMDLIEQPEIVHHCLGKLFDLAYESTCRIFERLPGQVMMSYVAEDMGDQNNLMFSPRQIREFLLPGMKRMMDLVHQAGAFVFHHNDGNCRPILPDLIQAGIDILNPIQWRSKGMDREGLKRDFGDKLVFHGAMDNQYTLPFGTVEDVRQEVLDNLLILGAGGGYILAPCHNIQPITAPEKVVVMYETCYENGWL